MTPSTRRGSRIRAVALVPAGRAGDPAVDLHRGRPAQIAGAVLRPRWVRSRGGRLHEGRSGEVRVPRMSQGYQSGVSLAILLAAGQRFRIWPQTVGAPRFIVRRLPAGERIPRGMGAFDGGCFLRFPDAADARRRLEVGWLLLRGPPPARPVRRPRPPAPQLVSHTGAWSRARSSSISSTSRLMVRVTSRPRSRP